jgi:hypothetical protein
MRAAISLIIIVILGKECRSPQVCYKDFMSNKKFTVLAYLADSKNNYNEFTDSTVTEIINGSLSSRSKIIWRTCTEFTLITLEDRSAFWKPGDTMNVKIVEKMGDTIAVIGLAKGTSIPWKMVKID